MKIGYTRGHERWMNSLLEMVNVSIIIKNELKIKPAERRGECWSFLHTEANDDRREFQIENFKFKLPTFAWHKDISITWDRISMSVQRENFISMKWKNNGANINSQFTCITISRRLFFTFQQFWISEWSCVASESRTDWRDEWEHKHRITNFGV